MAIEQKTCTRCLSEKPITEFSILSRNKSGRNPACKECSNARHRKWASSEYYRKNNLKKSFNISVDKYNEMLDSQGGVCAICHKKETTIRAGKVQSLSVDHNHSTGKIRGLLCNSCNRALGKFKDSKKILFSALKYLENYDEE